jgi:hypothetical protein
MGLNREQLDAAAAARQVEMAGAKEAKFVRGLPEL